MSVARFGLKTGVKPNRPAQAATRLVAEFFAVRKGQIFDIQAVMVNRDESLPSAADSIDTPGIVKGDDPDLAGGLAIGSGNSGHDIAQARKVVDISHIEPLVAA